MRRALEVPAIAAGLPAVVSQDRRLPALAKAGSERVEDAALGARDFCKIRPQAIA